MSRFETGGLYNRGRNAATLPTGPLESVGLNVPGLDVPAPVTSRSDLASSLFTAFGLADRATGVVANDVEKQLGFQREMVAAQEHADNQTRIAAEHNRTIAENFGRSTIADAVPLLTSKIAQSTAVLSDEQIAAQARQDVLGATTGLDQVSIDSALVHGTPAIVQAYTSRREQLRTIAKATATEAVYNGTVASTEPDKFNASVDALEALHPEQSRDTLAQDLQAKAIAYQSNYGTRDGLDRALSLTDSVDPFVKSKAEYDFTVRQRAAEAVVNDKADNYLAGQLVDARDGKTSLDAVEKSYRAAFGKVVDSKKLHSGIASIDEAKRQQYSEMAKFNDNLVRQGVASSACNDAAAAAMSGGVWMLNANKDAYKGKLSDGKDYSLPDGELKDIQQHAVDSAAESIKKANAGSPAKGFADIVNLMARNKTATSEIDALVNNADAVASIDTLVPDRANSNSTKAVSAPPQLVAAVNAYSQTNAINPRVASFMVKDAKTKALYQTVDFVKTLPEYARRPAEDDASWTNRVILSSAEALDRSAWHGFGLGNDSVAETKIQEAMSATGSNWNWVGLGTPSLGKGANSTYVRDSLRARAQFFMATRQVSEDKAIQAATKSFYADHEYVHGSWVDFKERGIDRPTLEEATNIVALRYVNEEHVTGDAAREFGSSKELTLIPDTSGGWMLADAASLSPTHRDNVPGVARFTTNDLLKMVTDKHAIESGVADRERERLATHAAAEHINSLGSRIRTLNRLRVQFDRGT